MRTRTRRGLTIGATFALLVCARGTREAAADPALLAPPLELSAPSACIDAATFRAHLLALPATPGKTESPRAIAVHIEESSGTFVGALRVTHANGTETTREVTSDRCLEVTDALEFVAALALGLEAHVPASASATGVTTATKTTIATPVPAAPPARVEARRAPPPSPPAPWQFAAGAYGRVVGIGGPQPLFGAGASVGLVLDRSGPLAPALHLSGTWAGSGAIVTPLGTATMTLVEAALEACPVRLAIGLGFALRPCVAAEAGTLTASARASNLVGAPSQSRFWGAASLLARVEWKIGKHFMFGGEGGAVLPFAYDHFFFTSDILAANVLTVASVGAEAKLGVWVVWP
jgi:hypothetical protein